MNVKVSPRESPFPLVRSAWRELLAEKRNQLGLGWCSTDLDIHSVGVIEHHLHGVSTRKQWTSTLGVQVAMVVCGGLWWSVVGE